MRATPPRNSGSVVQMVNRSLGGGWGGRFDDGERAARWRAVMSLGQKEAFLSFLAGVVPTRLRVWSRIV